VNSADLRAAGIGIGHTVDQPGGEVELLRAAWAIALMVVTAAGQQPVSQVPGTTVKFSATANLVVVDVTVKDKAMGRPSKI